MASRPFDFGSDANWLPHRFDEARDGFRFVRVSRAAHRKATFLTDEFLEGTDRFHFVPRAEIDPAAIDQGPVHFIFHSAYCCSTMLARAFDGEGWAMGLKEPQLLNDLLGWRRRGARTEQVASVLDLALSLLSRPFSHGEATVIKPSNILSPLAEQMMQLRPQSRALFLYAPIESYLQSIVKKGLWGRRWVREVLVGTIGDGYMIGGFEGQNLLELTDLQVAAVGWLSQHALFARLQKGPGGARIRTLDSATLLSEPRRTMQALADHFEVEMSPQRLEQVLNGPAFTTHSKDSSSPFTASDREQEQARIAQLYGEEIEMVATWTRAVAQSQGFALELPAPLVK